MPTDDSITTISAADHALIDLLREDARLPTAVLARRLGVSRTTVQSRIERLERAGIIAGYTLRLGGAYAAGLVRAHVMIVAAPKHAPQVTAALGRVREVVRVRSDSGAWDLIAELAAETVSALDTVIDRIGALEGVERTTTSIVLSTRFER